jgi:hypothetical protein
VLEAVAQNGLAFRFASEELRSDGSFALEIARRAVFGRAIN